MSLVKFALCEKCGNKLIEVKNGLVCGTTVCDKCGYENFRGIFISEEEKSDREKIKDILEDIELLGIYEDTKTFEYLKIRKKEALDALTEYVEDKDRILNFYKERVEKIETLAKEYDRDEIDKGMFIGEVFNILANGQRKP